MNWMPAILLASGVIVASWGYFLYQGVVDPLGGINSLWPLFGIANQLLAAVALVLATTILMKMRRMKWIWVTLLPMAWLVIVTMTASYEKIFSANGRIGFLANASGLAAQIAAGKIPAAKIAETQRVIFNQRLDAVVTGAGVDDSGFAGRGFGTVVRDLERAEEGGFARDAVCGDAMGGGRLMRTILGQAKTALRARGGCGNGAAMRPTNDMWNVRCGMGRRSRFRKRNSMWSN